MKTSKIIIKNLFGIREVELDNKSIELTGDNGTGKSSVIDAMRYALTNSSNRDFVIRRGETEGEILIETDTGLSINRKKRTNQSDYKSIKEGGRQITSPETFLQKIFTPLQLNPVAFTMMTRQEQNRIILDLIEFDWNLNWIKEKFGEIPRDVDYEQNILQVLHDIQAENGFYFKTRQDVNRDIRNKQAFIEDIAKDIPTSYQYEKWDTYDLGARYRELETIKDQNGKIQRAVAFRESYDNKIRGYEAERDIAMAAEEKAIANEREGLLKTIERLKAEIIAAEDRIKTLGDKLTDKQKVIEAEYQAKVAKLDTDIQIANEYADREPQDISELSDEITMAEQMIKHLNEYRRMKDMQGDIQALKEESEDLTRKIELARDLPGEILKTATIPVKGLTVKDGIPLIKGLPISNLSEGEQLDLCVDVAISKPNALQIILIDGAEKLSDKNRERLYKKCKQKGLQFIAARTTNENELVVTAL